MHRYEVMVQSLTHILLPGLTPNGASLGSLYTPHNFHYLNYQVPGHRYCSPDILVFVAKAKVYFLHGDTTK